MRHFNQQHLPSTGFNSFIVIMRFSLASPVTLLLTHPTVTQLGSVTDTVTLTLAMWFDTVVIKYSVRFSNSGILMVSDGNPSLTHIRTSKQTSHAGVFKIFGRAVNIHTSRIITSHQNNSVV